MGSRTPLFVELASTVAPILPMTRPSESPVPVAAASSASQAKILPMPPDAAT
jgi:hypothetical protein